MSDNLENPKTGFEYYLAFPPEIRMMVIDEMAADDRTRFQRCSKSSREEVRRSKKFMYGLVFHYDTEEDVMEIRVLYDKEEQEEEENVGENEEENDDEDEEDEDEEEEEEEHENEEVEVEEKDEDMEDEEGIEDEEENVQNEEENENMEVVEEQPIADTGYGFVLQFKAENGRKYMIYSNVYYEELWRIDLCSSTDLKQFAANYFKHILKYGQNVIKKLVIELGPAKNELGDFDYEVENLKNLEYIETNFNTDIMRFISKLRRPLKGMAIHGQRNNQILENYEFSTIQEVIFMPFIEFDYAQFLQLRASVVTTNIGGLTEKDVFEYIKLWKTGKTGKENVDYEWILQGSNFDFQKLLNLLGVEKNVSRRSTKVFIEHGVEESTKAMLFYDHTWLIFDTNEKNFRKYS